MRNIFFIKKYYQILAYFFIVILYGTVGFFSPGYDDEFFNINLIETYGIKSLSIVQTGDVHPPASYLINWILYSLVNDWHIVRLLISIFSAILIIKSISNIKITYGNTSFIIAFFLIALNPAILMWTTGLRWYAFFVPLLLWAFFVPNTQDWRYWAKCFGSLLILGYLGYAVIIVALPLILFYWFNCEQDKVKKIKHFFIFGVISFLLYLPQILIFIKYHLPNKESQVFDISSSLIGFVSAIFSNQGLFPLSIFGVISAIGFSGICCIYIYSLFMEINDKKLLKENYFLSFFLSIFLLIFTGLAGKLRNFLIVSPIQGLWISTIIKGVKFKKLFLVCVFLVSVGNIIGVFNVINHKDTTKNSWNLPINDLTKYLEKESSNCSNRFLVLSHDPVISNYLYLDKGYNSLSPYLIKSFNQPDLNKNYSCIFVIKTFQGALSSNQINDLYRAINEIKYLHKTEIKIGFDKYADIKRKINSDYPTYQIEVTKYSNPSDIKKLAIWNVSIM